MKQIQQKKTKIVATIGPASRDKKILTEMIHAGLNVIRMNFSHGTHEDHLDTLNLVRAAEKSAKKPVAILQDLSGPKIRVGKIKEGSIEWEKTDIILATMVPEVNQTNSPVIERTTDVNNRIMSALNQHLSKKPWSDSNSNTTEKKEQPWKISAPEALYTDKVSQEEIIISWEAVAWAEWYNITKDGDYFITVKDEDNATYSESFNINVQVSVTEKCVEDITSALTFDDIRGENIVQNYIEHNLTLEGDKNSVCSGAIISWSSSDTNVTSNKGIIYKGSIEK